MEKRINMYVLYNYIVLIKNISSSISHFYFDSISVKLKQRKNNNYKLHGLFLVFLSIGNLEKGMCKLLMYLSREQIYQFRI